MSRNFISDFHLKNRMPLKSFTDVIINKDVNYDGTELCFKLDIINIIETYLNNVQDGGLNNRKILKNLDLLISNLKYDYLNYCEGYNRGLNPAFKTKKFISLLSIVDIEMEIPDDTICKEVNVPYKEYDKKSNFKSILILKEKSINTESILKDDKCVQTIECIKLNKQDNLNAMQNLVWQSNDVQLLVETFMRKNKHLMERKNNAYFKLSKAIKYYQAYFEQRMVTFSEFGTQTEESWLQDWNVIKDGSIKLDYMLELINQITNKNKEMEEKLLLQSSEVQSQLEMIEELTTKNSEWLKRLDIITTELLELKEINEFLESENQGLTISNDRLYEDFNAYTKLHDQTKGDLELSFRADRCRLLLERRIYLQKIADKEQHLMVVKQDRKFSKDRISKLNESVYDYYDKYTSYETVTADLNARIAVVTEKISRQRRDKELWAAEREVIIKNESDRVSALNERLSLLKDRFDERDTSLKSVRAENDRYRGCLMELRTVSLQASERGTHDEVDMYRDILTMLDKPDH